MAKEDGTPQVDQNSDPPWYEKHGVASEDHGILGKYKDETEAIRSIGARERYVSQSVRLPDAKAKPEERAKQTREILGRLGAHDSPEKYKESIVSLIPEDLKKDIGEDKLDAIAKKAFEQGILPDVFVGAFKENLQALVDQQTAAKEDETAANQTRVDHDNELTKMWGRDKTNKLKDGETFARHLDSVFSELNRTRFTTEEMANGGGVFYRMLTGTTAPEMKLLFADMQRRLFGEGEHHEHSAPSGRGSVWQQHYDSFMRDCGALGEQKAREYADQMTGGPR